MNSVIAQASDSGCLVMDRSCGHCLECAAGADIWCLQPLAEGVIVAQSVHDSGRTIAALEAAAALLAANPSPDAVVMVLTDDAVLAGLCAVVYRGLDDAVARPDLIVTADPRSVHIGTPTGRADVIVTAQRARTAVRAVRRGGVVALASGELEAPSVTEVVQRELTLVAARSMRAVLDRHGEEVRACLSR